MRERLWDDDVPIVEVVLPSCPFCGHLKYAPVRGWKDADGGRTSYRVCKRCMERYIVISVNPELGFSE